MRLSLALAPLLVALATPAVACQCDDPADYSAKQRDEHARWIVEQGFAIAEVEREAESDPMQRERYRVHRRILGHVPDDIVVQRHVVTNPDGRQMVVPVSSCDYVGAPGQRTIMAFTDRGVVPSCGVLTRLSSSLLRAATMCTQFAVQNPAVLARVLRLSAAKKRYRRNGSSRSNRPPSSSR